MFSSRYAQILLAAATGELAGLFMAAGLHWAALTACVAVGFQAVYFSSNDEAN